MMVPMMNIFRRVDLATKQQPNFAPVYKISMYPVWLATIMDAGGGFLPGISMRVSDTCTGRVPG